MLLIRISSYGLRLRFALILALVLLASVFAAPATAQTTEQESEQEGESGDADQLGEVLNEGDNANQCAGITGNANTGNAQNQIGVTDFGTFNGFDRFDRNRFDGNPFFFDGFNGNGGDFGFEDTGADLTVTGTSTTTCDQQVNQAAAAG